MVRRTRLVMMVLVAMLLVAAPAALAQSPTADQYSAAGADGSGGGTGASGDPISVDGATAADLDKLPFTGGQASLIALIGLALLVVGLMVLAATRRREPPLRA